jgi:hypothetical protein
LRDGSLLVINLQTAMALNDAMLLARAGEVIE